MSDVIRRLAKQLSPARPFPTPDQVNAAVGGDIGGTVARLMQQKPDASGGNARFYRLPGDQLGMRVVTWHDLPPHRPDYRLRYADDPLEGRNFGQAAATYGPEGRADAPVQVVWLQHGDPAGAQRSRISDPAEVEKYRRKLEAAADFPVDAYSQAMEDMKFLHSKGYSVDPSKSGNLLIDSNAGRLGFVDVAPGTYRAPGSVIGTMLADNYSFAETLAADPGARSLLRGIVDKTTRAAKETGLPLDDGSSSWAYTQNLSRKDYRRPPPPAPPKPTIEPWEVW